MPEGSELPLQLEHGQLTTQGLKQRLSLQAAAFLEDPQNFRLPRRQDNGAAGVAFQRGGRLHRPGVTGFHGWQAVEVAVFA